MIVVFATAALFVWSISWIAFSVILRHRRAQPLDPRGAKAIHDAEDVVTLSQWWVLLSLAVLAVSALVL
ncbi:membrane protein [Microbacterium phage Cece]|nr:membrane protein [Microbacterium phage Cece]